MSVPHIDITNMDLDTDELLIELRTVNSDITEDLSSISGSLDSFTDDFNTTLAFFKSIDRSLESVYGVYHEYEYHIQVILYIILGIIGLILFIQLTVLLFKCPECYIFLSTYLQDFQQFRT